MIEVRRKIIDVAKSAVEKATQRLNRISFNEWRFETPIINLTSISDEDSICSYLEAECEKIGFYGVMCVAEKDVSAVLKGFSVNDYWKAGIEVYEFFVNELGNIVLNSILGEFANRINKAIIPNHPKTIKGRKDFVVENISLMIKNKASTAIGIRLKVLMPHQIDIDVFCFISNGVLENI